jgi:hypothetical protein
MKTLANTDDNVFSSITLSNGTSFVTITAPPTGIYILSLPPNLGSSGQVLTTDGLGQTYCAAAAPSNYITSVDADFQVTAGELSFSPAFQLSLDAMELEIDSLQTTVDAPVTGLVAIVTTPVTGLQDLVIGLQTDLTALEGTVTTLEGTVTALEGTVTALEGTVTGLTADVAALDVTIYTPVTGLESVVAGLVVTTTALIADVSTINSRQITLTTPTSFLSVTGSPATGAAGTLTIGLGATALPTANGGTGLTTIGAPNTVLSSNGTTVSWAPVSTLITSDIGVATGYYLFANAHRLKHLR